jgi:hypothetical protein
VIAITDQAQGFAAFCAIMKFLRSRSARKRSFLKRWRRRELKQIVELSPAAPADAGRTVSAAKPACGEQQRTEKYGEHVHHH